MTTLSCSSCHPCSMCEYIYSSPILTKTTCFSFLCHALKYCQADGLIHSSEENQTGIKPERKEWHVTHTHKHNFTQTTARAHTQSVMHTFLVSVILWLAFPGVALSAWAFHTSSLPDWEQHWSDGQRVCNQADSWSEAAKQRVVVRQRDRLCGSGARTWIFILP